MQTNTTYSNVLDCENGLRVTELKTSMYVILKERQVEDTLKASMLPNKENEETDKRDE